jgi:hypothetical protein
MSGVEEGERRGLLEAAESWPEDKVEANYQQLLDHIHSVLADEDTTLEIRWYIRILHF